MTEKFAREFEGYEVLDSLLAQTGAVALAEDVAEAFAQAAKDGADARDVIADLWAEEPRFSSPAQAARTFGNLLALFDLVASGKAGAKKAPKVKRVKAARPEPFDGEPTLEFFAAASRYFDDYQKEHERHVHAFDNRQDALMQWLDSEAGSDEVFALCRYALLELFAALELGGRRVRTVDLAQIPATSALPQVLSDWLEGLLNDERETETFSDEAFARVQQLAARAATAVWQHST